MTQKRIDGARKRAEKKGGQTDLSTPDEYCPEIIDESGTVCAEHCAPGSTACELHREVN